MAAGFVGLETRNLSENVITETQVMTAQFIVMVKQNGRTITMSILIKGMEMPKVGGKIITIYADGRVLYDGGYIKAAPVPPHGKLIDADKNTFPTPHRNPSNDYMKGWNACLHSVQQQPTVIPAEEET